MIKTQLVGHFNISNALGVMGALLAKGLACAPPSKPKRCSRRRAACSRWAARMRR
jgi:hypothetical protein